MNHYNTNPTDQKSVGKIEKKYFAWIWVGLFFASLFNSLYAIIIGYFSTPMSALELVINIALDIAIEGALPTVLCYLVATVFFSMAYRRGIRNVNRNDFIYEVMLTMSVARVVMGVIKLFAFLSPTVDFYCSMMLDIVVVTALLYALYFKAIAPQLHPRQSAVVFGMWTGVYVAYHAIAEGLSAIVFLVTQDGSDLIYDVNALLVEVGYAPLSGLTEVEYIACYITLALIVVLIAVTVVLNVRLKKAAKESEPIRAGEYGTPYGNPYSYGSQYGNPQYGNGYANRNQFDGNPFEETTSQPDGHGEGGDNDSVFEEFDI